MENKQTSYRNIVKTTSLFGGVQVVQILASVVRGKLVAVLLGAVGMGINTLFVSLINLVAQAASLGLNFSAVRDIAKATESGDNERIAHILKTFNRWILFCAMLGAVVTFALAGVISEMSFEDASYTNWIRVVSLAVFLTILSNSRTTVLQGTRNYRPLAKSSLIGALFGLCTSIPLYYFFGDQGIVPALIIAAGTTYCVGWFFVRKIDTPKVQQSVAQSFHQGKDMTKLGLVLMAASFLGMLTIYLINSYVSKYGSLADVGFYGAGTGITNQYIGLVFTAMATDYFPRLSAVSDDREKVRQMVNQQAEIVILISAPLIMLMMLTAPLLIRILLSAEFMVIREFICILAFGMIFKAASYAIGYISFAKGDKKFFFWFEGVYGNASTLVLNVVGYYLWGLTGMAISFAVSFAIYLVLVLGVTYRRYGFRLERECVRIFLCALLGVVLVFLQTLFFADAIGYVAGGIIAIFAVWFSFHELDKRIAIKQLIGQKLNRKGSNE